MLILNNKNYFKFFLHFFLLLLCSQLAWSLEADDAVLSSMPVEFQKNYLINNGIITSRLTLNSNLGFRVQRSEQEFHAFKTENEQTTWSVLGKKCFQNKAFNCVSSYKKSEQEFKLFRLNPNKSNESVVIECKAIFKENLIIDDGWLKHCLQYSQKSCDDWNTFLPTIESFYLKSRNKNVLKNSTESSAAKINAKVRELFQADVESFKIDLEKNFQESTSDTTKIKLKPDLNIETQHLNTTAIAYQHIFLIEKKCQEFASLFKRDEEIKSILQNKNTQLPETTTAPNKTAH